jgi:hypothetical protein
MSRLCDYRPLADATRTRWACSRCGHVTEIPLAAPPVRKCRSGKSAGGFCSERTPEAEITIPGYGLEHCGCGAVLLFECRMFAELVTLAGLKPETRNLVTAWNRTTQARYKGRACNRCKSVTLRISPL